MSAIGKPERTTQDRVINLFVDELGYDSLGNWQDRADNGNLEAGLLREHLRTAGYAAAAIDRALDLLGQAVAKHGQGLYATNQAVYQLLRYGVPVKTEAGRPTETVALVDWDQPAANHFAIAEEVTLSGTHERRPDLVLYCNGIAVAVLELKNSRVGLGDGIRQLCSCQQPAFHERFFATVQLLLAGNDSEGLAYGAIGTPAKHYLRWKEDEADARGYKLDKYLRKLCRKERLLELIRDFVLFDGGVKKVPRPHQYFGIKAAQQRIGEGRGGIIWHTQGSGKSIVMVLLAKWILEHRPAARVVVVTDRYELDKQIKRVFEDAGEAIHHAASGRDLMAQLGRPRPRLLCSLVHKFGRRDVDDLDAFIAELEGQPSPTVSEVVVFVDECHRTQSGKLHRLMKAMMPAATFIGFTGTPLLKKDKATSLEIFGDYIHTYKFGEAVEDEVVLDLVYEARDIDQRLGSPEKIDAWFDAKTRGLNDWQKDELKKQWATMQRVLSSRDRMERIVADITFDFSTRPRLSSERGNALLVASSIYEACRYFALFQRSVFKDRCAVVTSYNPQASDISTEEVGANTETDKQFIYQTYTELLQDVTPQRGMSATETYEEAAKRRFIHEPAAMRLLIVVDKLLTGFDAPPCTYLYIDKAMQDHGLFQAICRTNRLDGEDKDFGHIVDYKDLFKKVEKTIAVYSSELDHSAPGASPEVLMKDRLSIGRERLDQALESLELLCEPVEPPRGELEHIHYFCGNTEIPDDLAECEPQRAALYKGVVHLIRAYAKIGDDLEAAGYDATDIARIQARQKHYLALRDTIRQASGETLDLKPYEADMRHFIDTYIQAEEPRKISPFDDIGLLDLIVKTGVADAIAARLGGLAGNQEAVAETIENNVRSTIIKEHLNNPAFFDRMSTQLQEIIEQRRAKALDYEEYLAKIAELVKRVQSGHAEHIPEILKHAPGMRAIYDNIPDELVPPDDGRPPTRVAEGSDQPPIDRRLALAERIHETIRYVAPADWRGVDPRERIIMAAICPLLNDDVEATKRLFEVIKSQKDY